MKLQFFAAFFIALLLCSTPGRSQNIFVPTEQDTTLAPKFFNRAVVLFWMAGRVYRGV